MIFAVFDPSPLTVCINCSFLHLSLIHSSIKSTSFTNSSHHRPPSCLRSTFISVFINNTWDRFVQPATCNHTSCIILRVVQSNGGWVHSRCTPRQVYTHLSQRVQWSHVWPSSDCWHVTSADHVDETQPDTQTHTQTDRHRHTDTQTHTQTDRQTHTQTDRHRLTDTHRDTHSQTHTHTDRLTDKHNIIHSSINSTAQRWWW